MVSILIIDDHQVYLDGLEMIISASISDIQVYKAYDIQSALECMKLNPHMDLILLDLNLASDSGLQVWQSLLESYDSLPVAILTASERPQDIHECKNKGALGFINKSCDNASLIKAIKDMLEGNLYFPYNIDKAPKIKLTPRQQEVLNLLAEGLPNKTICSRLSMSEATVKTHLRTLFSLLDVNTRTQCVNVAIKQELI